ncbi:MAG TPA: 2Fe-2S iron-sulfur cluster-binding protein [Trueperaceae bacterium]
MPKLTVDDKRADFPAGTRLVLAIEELGIAIGHRCGGKARCTTCRVRFLSGEPDTMTRAEMDKLTEKGLLGSYRLSCQIELNHDMQVVPAMTLESEGWTDTGPAPAPTIEPQPVLHESLQPKRD